MKVAIYSGVIPSTTFIENLIKVISGNHNFKIILFGTVIKRVNYRKKTVKIISSPSHGFKRYLHGIYLYLIVGIFKKNELNILFQSDAYLDKSNMRSKILWLSKTLPVILNKPDIFHIQWAHAVKDWIWLQELGVKVICSLRGGQINYSPLANKDVSKRYMELFPKVDAFHAVSRAIANEAQKYGAEKSSIRIIYSAVDLDKINMLKVNLECDSIKSQKCKILSVGRFHWKKGYLYSIDAMKILKDRNIDFNYKIVATGNHQQYLHQIHDLGLDENVTIVNGLSHDQVIKEMKESDIFLLPSIEEGIANVTLEAMAAGSLVVSTNAGGMREVVIEGKNGFLIERYKPTLIANKIENILHLSSVNKNEMVREAYETVVNSYSFRRLTNEFNSFYKQVLAD